MKRFVCNFLILFFLFEGKSFSQNYPDAGLWATSNIEWKLNTRFSALFTQEFRLKENFSRLNLFYTNLGLEYRLTRALKTSFIYRLIQKYQLDNTFSYRHRLMWDASWKNKFNKIKISYRHRLQAEVRNYYTSKKGKLSEWYSRSKLQMEYDLEKSYTPYFATEWRYQIRDPRNEESDNVLHRARFQIGVNYKINDENELGLYYLVQREFNIADPEYLYIAGVEYNMTL